MKSINIYILFICFIVCGCDDFLEEKSQSEIRPATVNDMEKLLEGDSYFTKEEEPYFNTMTEIFSDDWKCNKLNTTAYKTKKATEKYMYSWNNLMFDEGGGGNNTKFWTIPYTRIMGCNVILDYMHEMDGNEDRRKHVLGEAHTLRAFYYLNLVNFFGLPYNYGDPNKNLGVPLKLVSGVTDELFKRNTVAQCYAQIEKDLLYGASLMKQGKSKASALKTRLNYLAAYGLLSRMYLYKEDWDNVIKYADSVLVEKSELVDITGKTLGVYDMDSSPEVLWGAITNWYTRADKVKFPYTPSDELVATYQLDIENQTVVDFRCDYTNKAKSVYFKYGKENVFDNNEFLGTDYWVSFVNKSGSNSTFLNGGIRVAELYLNRAEAYFRKYMTSSNASDAQAGMDDLNTLRRSRFGENYVDMAVSDFANAEELLNFCLRERRRELCSEGNHRWFDLRRNGMPEIKHIYIDEDNLEETEYVLEKGDSRYVLPIPKRVIEQNANLEQNNF